VPVVQPLLTGGFDFVGVSGGFFDLIGESENNSSSLCREILVFYSASMSLAYGNWCLIRMLGLISQKVLRQESLVLVR
jgi:hypothetical protein